MLPPSRPTPGTAMAHAVAPTTMLPPDGNPVHLALGLGLTNECNLHCPHCYRDTNGLQRLNLQQVRGILRALPVRAANLGTGENGLHPDFFIMVETLQAAGVKVSLTSNGYSVGVLPDALVKGFHEV